MAFPEDNMNEDSFGGAFAADNDQPMSGASDLNSFADAASDVPVEQLFRERIDQMLERDPDTGREFSETVVEREPEPAFEPEPALDPEPAFDPTLAFEAERESEPANNRAQEFEREERPDKSSRRKREKRNKGHKSGKGDKGAQNGSQSSESYRPTKSTSAKRSANDMPEHDTAIGMQSALDGRYDLRTHGRPPRNQDEEKNFGYEPYEMDGDYSFLPSPQAFEAYPPEVQRKIIEWTDRDVRARRDDESRRQDAILREKIANKKARSAIPVVIAILCILCAAVVSILTKDPVFALIFLVIPLAIVVSAIARAAGWGQGPRQ